MNSRRFIACPEAQDKAHGVKLARWTVGGYEFLVGCPADVRFGSKADMCAAKGHVRFAPNSDRESGFPQTVMSALPPKADIQYMRWNVR